MYKSLFERFLPHMAPEGGGETGGEDQKVAEPDVVELGGEDQKVAEPGNEEGKEEGPEDGDDDNTRGSAKAAANAALRRRAEEAEREAAELREKNLLSNQIFESEIKGKINPFTQAPIETVEDWKTYQEQYEAEQLRQAGLSPDYITNQIENHPAILKAKQLTEQLEEQQFNERIEKELVDIQKVNPDIKDVEDLNVKENFPDEDSFNLFWAAVKGGEPINQAYKTISRALQQKEPGKDTKGHIQTLGKRGGGAVTIPRETYDLYKTLMPNATDKEIREHYAKQTRKE